jgi:spermidine/putrescine transport system permease protein
VEAASQPGGRRPRVSPRLRRRLVPYLLLGPGLVWLIVFFAIPALNQAYVSLLDGSLETGYVFDWNFASYSEAISQYAGHFGRSIGYAGLATVFALLISFPLAYFIAFKAGRLKTLMLLLIVLPFFTSYLVRTVAWQTILADNGVVLDVLQAVGLVADDGRLLATGFAVVAGITYNFLPFMALPLYVSLEKIDRRLIEAATDLYASRLAAFRRVTLPLALPGIFAGSLLTFIPAAGDFINAQLLGTSRQYMIGNVIQSKFLVITDYPEAAALSFILLAAILVGVFAYARALGTDQLTEGVRG